MRADPIFAMSVDQLLEEAAKQLFMAQRAKGRSRRPYLERLDQIVHLIGTYVFTGMPQPISEQGGTQ